MVRYLLSPHTMRARKHSYDDSHRECLYQLELSMTERSFPKKSPIDVTIGANIRKNRRKSELPPNELAQLIGISLQQLQKYETGANRVSASMLVQVSEALKVWITDLLPNVDQKPDATDTVSQELDDLRAQIIDGLDDLDVVDLRSLLDATKAIS